MEKLWDFLGHQKIGLTELRYEGAGETLVGFFDDQSALLTTIEEYSLKAGRLLMGIQPRTPGLLDRAPNKLLPGVAGAVVTEITHLTCIATTIYHERDDEEQIDSGTVAMQAAQQVPSFVWQLDEDHYQLFIAIPALEVQDHDDVAKQTADFMEKFRSALPAHLLEAEFIPALDPTSYVSLTGEPANAIDRTEIPKIGTYLQRSIPAKVLDIINNARAGRVAKLFRGEGDLGADPMGKPLEPTSENYDAAFVRALIQKVPDVTKDDLIAALWNRPGSVSRSKGIDAVMEVVHNQILDAQHTKAAKKMGIGGRRPIGTTQLEYDPSTPLHERLQSDYLTYNQRTERYMRNIEVGTTTKAEKVLQFLFDNDAELYYFKDEQQAVFTFEGRQYPVNTKNQQYGKWFTKHVRYFGANHPEGRELTDALRSVVMDSDKCHYIGDVHWGYFDRDNRTMYYCFDPRHIDMIRIKPAEGDKPIVETVPNGTDGITLRGTQLRDFPFQYIPNRTLEGLNQLRQEIYARQCLGEVDRLMSLAFNLTMLIPDHINHPLKFHTGESGAGKSYCADDWACVLYGKTVSTTFDSKPALLNALKYGGPLISQDNVEKSDRRKFDNLYLVSSTGGTTSLRKLYTEADEVKFGCNGNLILTAIEPMAKSEEVRRAFEFEFQKKYKDPNALDETTQRKNVMAVSDLMLSAIFDTLSLKVLPDYDVRYEYCSKFIRKDVPQTRKHESFSGWMANMLVFAETFGGYLWDAERGDYPFDARQIMTDYIKEMLIHEKNARVEGNPGMMFLDQFKLDAARLIAGSTRRDATYYVSDVPVHLDEFGRLNLGPMTTAQLYRIFCDISKRTGLKNPYSDPRQLGSRMRLLAEEPGFCECGWERTKSAQTAHGKQHMYVYIFTPNAPGQLIEDVDAWDDDHTIGED